MRTRRGFQEKFCRFSAFLEKKEKKNRKTNRKLSPIYLFYHFRVKTNDEASRPAAFLSLDGLDSTLKNAVSGRRPVKLDKTRRLGNYFE